MNYRYRRLVRIISLKVMDYMNRGHNKASCAFAESYNVEVVCHHTGELILAVNEALAAHGIEITKYKAYAVGPRAFLDLCYEQKPQEDLESIII